MVPQLPTGSNGISFSASQAINDAWGAFVRVSNASGAGALVETSVAFGGIRNDPFGRNPLDQAGLAFAWNKINYAANGVTPASARQSELVAELYYNYTIFKGLQITPDVQIFIHPALAPQTNAAAVFTVRTTALF
jgi:carbohydrate-selective porin OprB